MKCESALCVTLAFSSYFVLACLPPAVRWRWGLPVSLLTSIATVVLLFVVAKFGIERWFVTPLREGIDCGDEGRGLDDCDTVLLFARCRDARRSRGWQSCGPSLPRGGATPGVEDERRV